MEGGGRLSRTGRGCGGIKAVDSALLVDNERRIGDTCVRTVAFYYEVGEWQMENGWIFMILVTLRLNCANRKGPG